MLYLFAGRLTAQVAGTTYDPYLEISPFLVISWKCAGSEDVKVYSYKCDRSVKV